MFKDALGKGSLTIKVEKFKDDNIASVLTVDEQGRRMQDMMKMYGMAGMDPSMFAGPETLTLNANHELVKFITENKDNEHAKTFAKQLYDLAVLANRPLAPADMQAFVARSNEIMMLLTR